MQIILHQLELFYYATLHGGAANAASSMPYGIDRSTISRQLCDLERQTGLHLFNRRPFKPTPVGEQLFAVLKPVMGDLPGMIQVWRKGLPGSVRLGGSPVVLREYLPPILARLQKDFPGLQLTCNEGSQEQIESWLKGSLVDLAVTLNEGALPPDYESESLARLPLILLVPAKSRLRSASTLWRRRRIEEPLITLPRDHPVTHGFRKGLDQRNLEWPTALEANSMELVEAYVRQGLGIGLSLAMPNRSLTRSGIRGLPLSGFPPVAARMLWRRDPSAPLQALIKEVRRASRQLMASPAAY